MKKCFRIHESDNVATLLDDGADKGESFELIGASMDCLVHCCDAMSFGHKVAVFDIPIEGDIVKYGVVIGTATQQIYKGQWVHLHNCRSRIDVRSSTLDPYTGASQDVKYE